MILNIYFIPHLVDKDNLAMLYIFRKKKQTVNVLLQLAVPDIAHTSLPQSFSVVWKLLKNT